MDNDNDDQDDTNIRHRQVPITVGNRIEILDPEQIWNSAIISSVSHLTSSTLITVRYDGWDANWNEQLPSTSKRLAPIYTHTARLRCLVKLFNRSNGTGNVGGGSKHTKGKSMGKARTRGGGVGGGGKSKSSRKFCNLWPCAVYIRMAHEENSRALQDLAVEQKLFVSPYRPDLLPQYAQREWKNGGMWVSSGSDTVKFWKVDCEETFEAFKKTSGSNHMSGDGNIPSLGTLVNGFMEAYRECKSDRSIPGNYTHEILHKGTVLKKEFRGVENYHKLIGSDMKDWKDEIVDLKSLERITKIKKKVASSSTNSSSGAAAASSVKSSSSLSSMTSSASQQTGNEAGGRRTRRSSTGTVATSTDASVTGVRQSRRARSATKHFIEDAELESEILKASAASLSLSNEKAAMDRGMAMGVDMSLFQPGERAAARAAHANFKHIEEAEREGLEAGFVGVNRHGHGHDLRQLRSGGESPPPTLNSEREMSSPLTLEPGEAMLNTCTAIPMQDSNFNGYKITQSASGSMWIGSYQVRGNTIQVGEFRTQSEAKDAIDRSRAELIRSGSRQDASTDTTRSITITSPSSSISRRSSSSTKSSSPISPTIATNASTGGGGRSKRVGARKKMSPTNLLENKDDKAKAHKDREIAAISMSRAVSVAYRDPDDDDDDDRPQGGGNGSGPSSINGELKDTGFSMHNWTLAVVKDTDKIRLQQRFLEMKRKRRAEQNRQQDLYYDENRHQYRGHLQNVNIAPSKRARSKNAA